MAKIKLIAEPTFKAKVGIPVPGGEPAQVEFTFKHRTRDQAKAWVESLADKVDVTIVQEAVTGWELDDPFTPENVETLLQNYSGAADAIFKTYLQELRGARAKN